MSARRAFALLYFLSGATGLLYQVVWSRALTLEMGHTAAAVATVLAAFMGGLALGAALGGRRAVLVSGPSALRWYAGLEACVGLSALLVRPALALASPLLAAAYGDGPGGAGFAPLRVGLSLGVVALPATAMGATLPFAVRWLESHAPSSAGRLAGSLYAINTLGAAFGASAAGFLLLPSLGLARTTLTGVAINALVALAAWRLARRTDPARPAPPQVPAPPRRGRQRTGGAPVGPEPVPRAASLALAVSGFAALVHEVAWTRVLALVIGPTTYAFTTMVTAFIVGMALGATAGTWLLRRAQSPVRLLAWAQCVAAAAALGALASVPRLPLMIVSVIGADRGYTSVLVTESLLVFLVLLPLAVALGASFPLAVAAADAREGSAARPASQIYAWNTVGAIGGALTAGFLLLPAVGLRGTVLAAAILNLTVALGLAMAVPSLRTGRMRLAAAALTLAAAAWQLPAWKPTLMSAGLYRPVTPGAFDPAIEVDAGTLLYYGDGPTGTVSVKRVAGEISLAVNGKVDASNAGDMLTQKVLAHLPLLLHPAPRDIGIIGLGSGVTAGAALAHPVSSVDSIELSPEVVRASRFFDADSGRPLDDPRSRLIVGDGRTHLRFSRRRYDVIISEPSNPWMAGVAPLFTREVFASARARLRPGGVFCQWAHTYQLSESDLASIAAAFLAAFPDGSLWLVGEADVLLIGTRDGGLVERVAALEQRWTAAADARRDLERVEVRDAASLLALYVADGPRLAAFAGAAVVQTDDRTALEFSAPLTLYERDGPDLVERLRAIAREGPQPPAVAAALDSQDAEAWRRRAAMYLGAEAYGLAFDAASRAVSLDVESPAVDLMVKAAVPLGRSREVAARLEATAASDPRALAQALALSRLRAMQGDLDGATRVAAAAAERHPTDARAWAQLASVLGDVADADRLARVVAEIERRAPGTWAARYFAATAAFLQGDFARAIALGELAAGQDAGDGRALNLVGAARASLGDRDGARRAFETSLGQDPRDPVSYVNLARLELDGGNARRAVALFSEALILDPASRDARQGLDAAQAARF